jgi:predicted dehydrogenase
LRVPYYKSYEEMIAKEKIEGVVAAVPNNLHLPVVKTCAENGLHLLVGKPIAGTLAEADALCAAAKKTGYT